MNRKIKILYIYSSRFPTEKAHGYQVAKMCEAFAQDNEVLLLCPRIKNPSDLEDKKNFCEYYSISNNFFLKKLFCLDFHILKKIRMLRLWFLTHSFSYSLSTLFWIFSHNKRFDIIYSRASFNLYLLLFFKNKINSRMIYESHTFPRSKKSFRIKLAKKVDKMVVVTQNLKELYVRAGIDESKIIVEPDAVDLIQFDLKISKAKSRKRLKIPIEIQMVSFVGKFHTMNMEKGILEIIQSAGYLIDEFPQLYFYFVGGPLDREKKYRKIAEIHHLPQEKFVFLEKQPVKDIPLWLKASDILLMPHPKNNFYSYSVSPLKMFEYMASKRPIVGSQLPAIEEILKHGENALLGKPGSIKGIAKNIRKLLYDPLLRKKLSSQAFRDVQEHTWEKRAWRIFKCLI